MIIVLFPDADSEGIDMDNYTCPDACDVHSYAVDLSYTSLSGHIVENILKDDLSHIESDYHTALELLNRVEISYFEEIIREFSALETSINLFKSNIQLVGEFELKIIVDGISVLAKFALDDMLQINNTFAAYYAAYFEPNKNENTSISYSDYYSEHSSVALEIELLQEIQVNLDYLSQMLFNMNFTIQKDSIVYTDIESKTLRSLRRYINMIQQKTPDLTCANGNYNPCGLYPKLKSTVFNECKYMLEGRYIIQNDLESITQELLAIMNEEKNESMIHFPEDFIQQLIDVSLNTTLVKWCLAAYSTELQNAMEKINHLTAELDEYLTNLGDLNNIIKFDFEEETQTIAQMGNQILDWQTNYIHNEKERLDVANYFSYKELRELDEITDEFIRRFETKALEPLQDEISSLVGLLEVRD